MEGKKEDRQRRYKDLVKEEDWSEGRKEGEEIRGKSAVKRVSYRFNLA